jgi:uncharacterized protein (DUF362 family)
MKFVRIETLFTEEIERTNKRLSELYDNKDLLKEKIRLVGKGILDNQTIIRNKKIFLKPNWVSHNRKEEDELCLRTHDNFLISTVEILLENKPVSILIGDAPIQSSNWEKIIRNNLLETLNSLSVSHSVPIIFKDFRRVTFHPYKNNPINNRNPLSDYVIFDLGKESFLEPISSTRPIFRVTNYDPDRLAESHTLNKHKYCFTKEIFEADVVISIPKIKTHQKTGMTGALKNIVGLNGDKDYLPHHRVGGDKNGGDCYPGKNYLRRASEKTLDIANRNHGKKIYWLWYWLTAILWKLSRPKKVHHLAAGWYGNDTCWRMVMDLNKIAVYGNKDGTLSETPQRIIYSLCDGVIGGQGDGPLNPDPLALGIISFSNNSTLNDICMSTLMGFEPERIPLLRSALLHVQDQETEIILNENSVLLSDLMSYSILSDPSPGWREYLLK